MRGVVVQGSETARRPQSLKPIAGSSPQSARPKDPASSFPVSPSSQAYHPDTKPACRPLNAENRFGFCSLAYLTLSESQSTPAYDNQLQLGKLPASAVRRVERSSRLRPGPLGRQWLPWFCWRGAPALSLVLGISLACGGAWSWYTPPSAGWRPSGAAALPHRRHRGMTALHHATPHSTAILCRPLKRWLVKAGVRPGARRIQASWDLPNPSGVSLIELEGRGNSR